MGFDSITGQPLQHDSNLKSASPFDDKVLKSILLLLLIDIAGFLFFLAAFYLKKTKWAKTGSSAPLSWMTKRPDGPVLTGSPTSPTELPLTNTSYCAVEKSDKEDVENSIRHRSSSYKQDAPVTEVDDGASISSQAYKNNKKSFGSVYDGWVSVDTKGQKAT